MNYRPHWRPRPIHLALGIVAIFVLGLVWGWPWYEEHFRPMFWYVAKGERSFLAPWSFEFATADEAGNFAVPDGCLNLLLVVVAPRQGLGRDFWGPAWGSLTASANRNHAVLQLDATGSRSVEIRRTANALIVVLPGGALFQAPLKVGEATRIFKKIQMVHLLGERSGTTIMSSIADVVGPDASEVRDIIDKARSVPTSLPAMIN